MVLVALSLLVFLLSNRRVDNMWSDGRNGHLELRTSRYGQQATVNTPFMQSASTLYPIINIFDNISRYVIV